jgi:uncharacterized protein YndB with AHSA1/START domain
MNEDATIEYKPLTTSRTFKASLDGVWEAWTDPVQFSQWFAPDYFTIPVCELDARSGGAVRIDMRGPDGTIYPSRGVFKEVVKPERLVFTVAPLDERGDTLFEIMHAVLFTEEGERTLVQITTTVVSAGPEAGPYLVGMEAGLDQATQKLVRLLEQ